MTVMTEGLKALAGSSLRTVLSKAAATPLSGAFWAPSSRSLCNPRARRP